MLNLFSYKKKLYKRVSLPQSEPLYAHNMQHFNSKKGQFHVNVEQTSIKRVEIYRWAQLLVQIVKNKSFYCSKNLSSLHFWTAIIYNRDYKQWIKHISLTDNRVNEKDRSSIISQPFHFFQPLSIKYNLAFELLPILQKLITNYKNVPKYDKNAAIKFEYKPQRYKDSPQLFFFYSQTRHHKPQHN